MTKIQTVCLAAITVAAPFAHIACGQGTAQERQRGSKTAYPIEHLVVIFQENISFDHYFAAYPVALNLPGEPPFVAKPGTPAVNGLTQDLMTRNQNSLQPQRLDPSHAYTADQNQSQSAGKDGSSSFCPEWQPGFRASAILERSRSASYRRSQWTSSAW